MFMSMGRVNKPIHEKILEYLKSHNRREKIIKKPVEISPDKDMSIIAFAPDNTNEKSQNDTSIILIT